jgi:hypothetical protein
LTRLGVAALFLAAVIVAGAIGYHRLEGYTWLEALYMIIITLSTVGFREMRPLSPTGMIFNPSADERIEVEDRVVALGEVVRLRGLERRVEPSAPR